MENKYLNKTMRHIVIIDPIFRASRLQFSFYCAEAFKNNDGLEIDIITRTKSYTEQYNSLFRDINHKIHEVAKVEDDFWFGKISDANIESILDRLLELFLLKKIQYVYFSGGHEIFPEIVPILLKDKYTPLRSLNFLMIDYEANFIINSIFYLNTFNIFKLIKNVLSKYKTYNNNIKNKSYNLLFSKFIHFRIGMLDCRIKKNLFLNRNKFFFIPDPCPKIQDFQYIQSNRNQHLTKVLIVGLQTKRKGFDNIISLLNKYSKILTNIQFIFVGRLSEDTMQFKNKIYEFANRLEWHCGYFDENDMLSYYSKCDYVIIPYSKEFNGSSGVLGYAMALKKPVITTDHGYIGYLNKYYNLGFTYKYNDIDAMFNLINKIPQKNSEYYTKLQSNCELYVRDHSLEKHQYKIKEILLN